MTTDRYAWPPIRGERRPAPQPPPAKFAVERRIAAGWQFLAAVSDRGVVLIWLRATPGANEGYTVEVDYATLEEAAYVMTARPLGNTTFAEMK